MTSLGVDVSGWQGSVSLAAPVVQFVIAKATESTTFTDPQFAANMAKAQAAGKPRGGYHFLRGGVSGAAQCDFYLRTLGGADGHLCALDVEVAGAGSAVAGFLDEFAHQAPGHPLLVYSNRGLWSGAGGGDLSRWPFLVGWHAGYINGAYWPGSGTLDGVWAQAAGHLSLLSFGGLRSYPMVQFTDRASIPGIGSAIDGDVWLGTADQLTALTRASVTPGPTYHGGDMDLYRTPDGTIWDIGGGRKLGLTSMDAVNAYTAKGGVVQAISQAGADVFPTVILEPTADQIAAAVAKVIPASTPAVVDVQGLVQALLPGIVAAIPPAQAAATVDVAALAAELVPHLPPATDPAVVAADVAANLAARLQA